MLRKDSIDKYFTSDAIYCKSPLAPLWIYGIKLGMAALNAQRRRQREWWWWWQMAYETTGTANIMWKGPVKVAFDILDG